MRLEDKELYRHKIVNVRLTATTVKFAMRKRILSSDIDRVFMPFLAKLDPCLFNLLMSYLKSSLEHA